MVGWLVSHMGELWLRTVGGWINMPLPSMSVGLGQSCIVLRAVYSDTTQLNLTAYSQVSCVFVYDVMTYKLSQLLFTLSSWVQLSCVTINTPLDGGCPCKRAVLCFFLVLLTWAELTLQNISDCYWCRFVRLIEVWSLYHNLGDLQTTFEAKRCLDEKFGFCCIFQ